MSNRKLINQLLELEDIDLDVISKAAYALEAHEWQPIETAKDFDLIIGGWEFDGKIDYAESGYVNTGDWYDGKHGKIPERQPTHWKHIGTLPQPGDKDDLEV